MTCTYAKGVSHWLTEGIMHRLKISSVQSGKSSLTLQLLLQSEGPDIDSRAYDATNPRHKLRGALTVASSISFFLRGVGVGGLLPFSRFYFKDIVVTVATASRRNMHRLHTARPLSLTKLA